MITQSNYDVLLHCFGQEQNNPLNENKCTDFFLLGQNANVVGLMVMSIINRRDLKNTKVRNLQYLFSKQENLVSTLGTGNVGRLRRDYHILFPVEKQGTQPELPHAAESYAGLICQ